MGSLSVHPHRASLPGNEAVAFDASTTPGEIFYHSSVLGKALYETAEKLGIITYSYDGAVVLEGCTEKIDERRESLVKHLAPEIADRALQPPYWESSCRPSHDELTDMIKKFGAPSQGQAGYNSFYGRMASSIIDWTDFFNDDCIVRLSREPFSTLNRRMD